jgi:predicted DsbA family dithiol-disulfide isomerase
VTWLPFELHPEIPPEGIPRQEWHGRIAPVFERNGLAYNPPPDVVPSTKLALRVAELARDRGLHRPVHDRLMDAYWADARDIGDPETLRGLAAEAGLDDVEEAFAGDAFVARIAASTHQAGSIGVSGIPAFLLDERLLVLGAQPREVFEQAFGRLRP